MDDMEGSNNVVFELVKSPSSYQIRPVKECKLDALQMQCGFMVVSEIGSMIRKNHFIHLKVHA